MQFYVVAIFVQRTDCWLILKNNSNLMFLEVWFLQKVVPNDIIVVDSVLWLPSENIGWMNAF